MDYAKVKKETAYDVLYLYDVMENLGYMCNSSVVLFDTPLDVLFPKFIASRYAKGIEEGNPHYLIGFTGVEITQDLLNKRYESNWYFTLGDIHYWVGYAIALIQWYTMYTFEDILRKVPLSEWYYMFEVYHTMDESHLLSWADEVFFNNDLTSPEYRYLLYGRKG